MSALYNEHDAYPAAWLRNLIAEGHIAPGTVDERSIVDLEPEDFPAGHHQFHAFAGIGVWSYALRLAGWADDAPVWTGSCPCQPFSAAGRQRGNADDRHLWPSWFRLIRECRPPVIFGEQVASPAGLQWLDAVRADLEGEGYAFGAADLCAAGVGAPHIRQRLFFVAYADGGISGDRGLQRGGEQRLVTSDGGSGVVAHNVGDGRNRLEASRLHGRREGAGSGEAAARDADGAPGHDADGRGSALGMADPGRIGGEPDRLDAGLLGDTAGSGRQRQDGASIAEQGFGEGRNAGFWSDVTWIPCRDGKARPVEPGTFPLAHGVASRVGKLRAYGNAIVAPLAAEFVRAYLERGER